MTGEPFDAAPSTDSVTWKIHREVVLLIGWGRAILLQLAHPLVAAGVAEHSGFLTQPRGRWCRLRRTLDAMLTLSFGTANDAAEVVRNIDAIHKQVHGRLHEPAGRFAAGTVYSACDPHLLRWVHATLVDSFLITYELYVEPLTTEEKDRYCAEVGAIESLLGLPGGYLPTSVASLDDYLRHMYAGGEISVTATARELANAIVRPPVPVVASPFVCLFRLATVGLLPPPIRTAYGLSWDVRREKLLQFSAHVERRLLRLTPSIVRHWPVPRAARAPTKWSRSARRPWCFCPRRRN